MALNLGVTSCQSLEISLDQFVRGEVLEGSNAYYCEKCKEKVRTHTNSRLHARLFPARPVHSSRALVSPENHSEEDVHQIPAHRPLHPPHALRFRLGERPLHQIRRADPGRNRRLGLHPRRDRGDLFIWPHPLCLGRSSPGC